MLDLHGILHLINWKKKIKKLILTYFKVALKEENNKRSLSHLPFIPFIFSPSFISLFLSLYFSFLSLLKSSIRSTWKKKEILLITWDEIPCLLKKNKNRMGRIFIFYYFNLLTPNNITFFLIQKKSIASEVLDNSFWFDVGPKN